MPEGSPAAERRRFRPEPFTLFLCVLAAVGAALVLARAATHGPALHWDSVNYLGVARNLLAGNGFFDFDGSFYELWPPLYPAVLAAATLGFLDPLTVAGPLNALLFGLTVFVFGRFLARRLASPFLRVLAPLALTLSLPLGEMSWWALSETLFILLATLALVHADEFLARGRTSSLLWTAAFTGLAWQAKYLGIALAAVIGLLVLGARGGGSLLRRIERAGVFALVAGTPMALWLLRNLVVFDTAIANRETVAYDAGEILAAIGSGLASWTAFDLSGWGGRPGWPLAAAAGLAAGALAAGAAFFPGRGGLRGQGTGENGTGENRIGRPAFSWRPAAVFSLFGATYLGLLYAAMMAGHTWHGMQDRFLAPAYLPLLLAAAVLCDRLLLFASAPRRSAPAPASSGGGGGLRRYLSREGPLPRALGAVFALAVAGWVVGQVGPTAAALSRTNSADLFLPGGYSAEPWASSETLRYLRENPLPTVIYSNLTALVYLHAGPAKDSLRPLPTSRPIGWIVETEPRRFTPGEHVARWLERRQEGAFVVWFRNWSSNRNYDYGPPAMRVTPGLRPVADFLDGAIFEVDRRYRPDTNPYREAYEAVLSGDAGEPLVRSRFDLYRRGDSLVLVREPCAGEEVRDRFLLHYFPTDPESLGSHRAEYGFENRDFPFAEFGVLLPADDGGGGENPAGKSSGAKCVAVLPLPEFEVARVRIGQWAAGDEITWYETTRVDSDRFRKEYAALAAGARGDPAARGNYDLYLHDRTLAYLDDACAPEEDSARFFLHVYPRSREDLPPDAAPRDFENRDFDFSTLGLRLAGKCLALAPLPAYPIARIRTGQWVSGEGELWSADFEPPPAPRPPAH